MKRYSILVALVACGPAPAHDPARVYGAPARACATRYEPPPGASAEVTLVVSDEARADFVLQGFCMQLDGAAVMLTDKLEIAERRSATRHIRVTPGVHSFAALGVWRGAKDRGYSFEVETSHMFDAGTTTSVSATAYESKRNVPVQERLKIEWIDKREER